MANNKFHLSYSPKEGQISKLAHELYLEQLEEIRDIKENTFSLHALYVFSEGEHVEVKVFFINATDKKANLKYVPLVLLNEDNKVIAGQMMDLTDVGEIPPMNVRPYSVYFDKKNITDMSQVNDKCRVIIDTGMVSARQSKKSIIDYVDDKISLYERKLIEKDIEDMPAIVYKDVKLSVYKSGIDEQNHVYVILLLSNGSDKTARLGSFKLAFRDHIGFIQAIKNIDDLPEVKPQCTSVFKVIFESKDILKKPLNPAACKVSIEI